MTQSKSNNSIQRRRTQVYAKTGTCFWVWEDETTEYPELYKLAAYFDYRTEKGVKESPYILAVSLNTGITWDAPTTCNLGDYEDFGDEYLYIRRDFLHEVFNNAHRFVEAGASIQHN